MKSVFLILLTFIALNTPVYAADIPKLITNRDALGDKVLYPVTEKPLLHDVYDLSFVAYDAAFAKEFGLVDTNVTEMDKHLRYMEIRMLTEGQQTNCYYNLILDKTVDIDFPEENFYHQGFTPELNLPIKLPFSTETYQHFAELRAGRKIMVDQRFNNRTHLGNPGYQFHSEGIPFTDGSVSMVPVKFYIQDRLVPFHIISNSLSCGGSAIYAYPHPSVWIRKQGHKENTLLPQLKDYHIFTIPPSIVKPFFPALLQFEEAERRRINQKIINDLNH